MQSLAIASTTTALSMSPAAAWTSTAPASSLRARRSTRRKSRTCATRTARRRVSRNDPASLRGLTEGIDRACRAGGQPTTITRPRVAVAVGPVVDRRQGRAHHGPARASPTSKACAGPVTVPFVALVAARFAGPGFPADAATRWPGESRSQHSTRSRIRRRARWGCSGRRHGRHRRPERRQRRRQKRWLRPRRSGCSRPNVEGADRSGIRDRRRSQEGHRRRRQRPCSCPDTCFDHVQTRDYAFSICVGASKVRQNAGAVSTFTPAIDVVAPMNRQQGAPSPVATTARR